MTDLSPQAEAVYDAILTAAIRYDTSWHVIIAATLRAAVDQVLPEEPYPPDTPDYPDDVTIKPFYSWLQRCKTRSDLLSIATELENHNDP